MKLAAVLLTLLLAACGPSAPADPAVKAKQYDEDMVVHRHNGAVCIRDPRWNWHCFIEGSNK